MNLRPYQIEAIEKLRNSIASGHKRPLLQAATGSGKTVISAAIIKSAMNRMKRVLFLAPRKELILQASAKLADSGIEHGIIMAGEPRHMYARVQVASFDTLHSRAIRREVMLMPDADLVVADEAHLTIARTRKEILNSYPDAVLIGLTATPARGDGRGLGEIYDDLIQVATIRELTEAGYLCPLRYYAPSKPDLDGLKLNKDGDYIAKALGERVDKVHLIGDIVSNWKRIASDKKTVVFCVNCKHSIHIAEQFNRNGYRAEHVDGETPADERKAIFDRIRSGETQVLCNVYVASYGLDIPSLECAVLARPTKSITMFLQTVGRIMRPAAGKEYGVVIDHSGCVEEHGFVGDFIPWSLDADSTVKERRERQQKEKQEPKEITCVQCKTVFKGRRDCPECGHEMVKHGKSIPTHQADLKEVKREQAKVKKEMSWPERISFYGQLKQYCIDTGKKPGWAAHKWMALVGTWPNDRRLKESRAIPVTTEVRNWITSQNIRYANRRTA